VKLPIVLIRVAVNAPDAAGVFLSWAVFALIHPTNCCMYCRCPCWI